ncbi:MAG TPA: DNA polymerase III subunit gamma/tau [Candidatus Paceibacterota bacterium]
METALYRKYRPHTFKEVRGQDHIVSVLEAAITNGKIAHAYLFCGSRGTGKTSMARILARAVGTTEKDLYEMDAASQTGVDDIRALQEGVATLPFDSKYKVYVIDEVHMLSKSAFNALLKTLEEPPSHVIFMLATTETDKVPETVVSRCQVFEFKKPSHDILKKMILDVAKKEGATLAPSSAELVALMAEGSYRDALGTLQKVLTVSGDKKLSEDEVAKVVGAPTHSLVNGFLEALAGKETGKAIALAHRGVEGGADPRVFTMLVLQKVRGVLLMRVAPEMKEALAEQFSEEDLSILTELGGKRGVAINSALLSELIGAYIDMNRAPIPLIPLELALMRALGDK